ncbi:DUF5403 family protein [Streptomyces syringium]|uniref:DUF5403 family protein n=1 Tax=Streptomyces syringium TaxID=76729 RepID=UPI003D89B6EF
MANVKSTVNGRPIGEYIALNRGVQAELTARAFEIGVRAEELLAQHRADGHARIEVDTGKVDRFVVLSDERGQNAALSIEYGRRANYVVREDRHGNPYIDLIPAADGLYILARASHLPKKRKGKVKLD